MNKIYAGILSLSVFLSCCCAVSAADYSFYVRNRPFSGTAFIKGRTVFVGAEDLLKTIGYSYVLEGQSLYVYVKKVQSTPLDLSAGVYTVYFSGRASSVEFKNINGRIMADAESLAKAMNMIYKVSDDLNTVDLLLPSAVKTQNADAAEKTKEKAENKPKKDNSLSFKSKVNAVYSWRNDGTISALGAESDVRPESADIYYSPATLNTSSVVYFNSVTLKNCGSYVSDASVSVNIICNDKNEFSFTKQAGAFKAGETKKIELSDLWNNPSGCGFKLLIKITHDKPEN